MVVAGGVLLLASLVRWGWEAGVEPAAVPGDTAVAAALLEASREELEEEEVRRRPLAEGERLDPNRAPPAQLDRLPGVGPATARTIVQEREANGYFKGPDDLTRVRGIGPATLRRMIPHLDFSRPPPARPVLRRPRPAAEAILDSRREGEEESRVDVNRAGEVELQKLNGIGPALARRIVEFRREHGPFRQLEDLLGVRGIGPGTLTRLKDQVRMGR